MRALEGWWTGRAAAWRLARLAAAAAFAAPLAAAGGQSVSVSSASTPTLRVWTATPGQPPTAVAESAGTYTYLAPLLSAGRLQARLSETPPPGVTIEVSVDTDARATNHGWVTLSTAYADVVTNYPAAGSGTYEIRYRITATSAAGVLSAQSRIVTLRSST